MRKVNIFHTWENMKYEKYTPGLLLENEKNLENETQTLYKLEYVEKHYKMWKMRNAHCRTKSMARKLKKCGK
jgi:hypothetical protein